MFRVLFWRNYFGSRIVLRRIVLGGVGVVVIVRMREIECLNGSRSCGWRGGRCRREDSIFFFFK